MFLSLVSNQSWQRRHTVNTCHFWVWDFKCLGCEIRLWFSVSLQGKMQSASSQKQSCSGDYALCGSRRTHNPTLGVGDREGRQRPATCFFFNEVLLEYCYIHFTFPVIADCALQQLSTYSSLCYPRTLQYLFIPFRKDLPAPSPWTT